MWQPKVITCGGFDERELVLHVSETEKGRHDGEWAPWHIYGGENALASTCAVG